MSYNASKCYVSAFAFFWVVAFVFYFNTSGAGFVTDEVGWLLKYQSIGWSGVFNAFGDQSLHFFYHLVGFLLWKIFGLNGFAWSLFCVSMHAAVACIALNIFSYLYSEEKIPYAPVVAFCGSLLFLISPYQTEVVVWYACIHYLICSLLLLLAFRFLLLYLRDKEIIYVVCFHICFSISLFTLEISFTFPILVLAFFYLKPVKSLNGITKCSGVKIFVFPSLVLLLIYLLLSQLFLGSAVGHYGAATHLNFDFQLLVSNFSKYLAKIFLFTQFTTYDFRHHLYIFFEQKEFVYFFYLCLLVIIGAYLFFQKRLNGKMRMLAVLFVFFVAALLPVLNLFFSYLVNIEGDRLSYFASVFAYQFLALLCLYLFRNFGWAVLSVAFFFSVKFLSVNVNSWEHSGEVSRSLVDRAGNFSSHEVYLLNVPDNFRGAYLLRSHSGLSAFAKMLLLKTGRDIRDNVEEVLHYNMNNLSDSVTVEKISDNQLKITFAQWGNWWWREGKGATDYSTERYKVTVDEWSYSYIFERKTKNRDAIYLYQSGGEWRKVNDF